LCSRKLPEAGLIVPFCSTYRTNCSPFRILFSKVPVLWN
jgi:hypothetical protein